MKIRQTGFAMVAYMLAVAASVQAQDFSKAGSSAAQFLKIPVGARAASMANTFSSIADDISTLYWNPAGAASLRRVEMGVSHSRWIADIAHDFVGIALPLGEHGAVGVSAVQLSSGDIEMTTIDKPKGTGTFYDARDLAFAVTYSQYLIEQVSVGISAKYRSQRIWNTSAQTVAFDFGVVLHTGVHGMKLGLSFQNFGPGLTMAGSDLIKPIDLDAASTINPPAEAQLKTQPFGLPTSYRASVSMPLIGETAPLQIESSTLIVALDALHLNDNREHYGIGGEYGFARTLFLRGGYTFNTDEEGLSLGTGVNVDLGSTTVYFDYAYVTFGVFDAVHMFSVGMRL
jgi:hypothetical protein